MQELRVTIQAEVVIVPGETRVRFISPGRGEDYDSQQFFEKYDGKTGTLVGYCTEYAGIHDWQGRKPGVYIKRDGSGERFTPVKILFDGESEPKTVKFCHLAVTSGFRITREEKPDTDQWYVGELPEPIAFYPGDTVYLNEDLLRTPREVKYVSFTEDGAVRYDLHHSQEEEKSIRTAEQEEDRQKPRMIRMASRLDFAAVRKCRQDLTLLRPGKLFVLYHGQPDDLAFESLEAEVAFWSQLDMSVRHGPEDRYGLQRNRLPTSLELLRSGEADVIYYLENVVPPSYNPRRLRPAFERFRERAQKASIAYWETQQEKDDRLYG